MLSKAELMKLDVAQRLELIEEIWETIASDPNADLPVTEAERAMLDQRLAEYEADPAAARPWAEVRRVLFPRK